MQPPLADAFFVRKNKTLYRIAYQELVYIHSDGNYCYFTDREKRKFAVKASLKSVLERLPPENFIRIHKSYIIQIDYLERLELGNQQAFVDGVAIPIGRTYLEALMPLLNVF